MGYFRITVFYFLLFTKSAESELYGSLNKNVCRKSFNFDSPSSLNLMAQNKNTDATCIRSANTYEEDEKKSKQVLNFLQRRFECLYAAAKDEKSQKFVCCENGGIDKDANSKENLILFKKILAAKVGILSMKFSIKTNLFYNRLSNKDFGIERALSHLSLYLDDQFTLKIFMFLFEELFNEKNYTQKNILPQIKPKIVAKISARNEQTIVANKFNEHIITFVASNFYFFKSKDKKYFPVIIKCQKSDTMLEVNGNNDGIMKNILNFIIETEEYKRLLSLCPEVSLVTNIVMSKENNLAELKGYHYVLGILILKIEVINELLFYEPESLTTKPIISKSAHSIIKNTKLLLRSFIFFFLSKYTMGDDIEHYILLLTFISYLNCENDTLAERFGLNEQIILSHRDDIRNIQSWVQSKQILIRVKGCEVKRVNIALRTIDLLSSKHLYQHIKYFNS